MKEETSISGETENLEIYVESDDVNPLHVNYVMDTDNIVGNIENETDITQNNSLIFNTQKTFLRNVRNSKRRKS